jgi:hypothetical protein
VSATESFKRGWTVLLFYPKARLTSECICDAPLICVLALLRRF